jgi:hypothetical protein
MLFKQIRFSFAGSFQCRLATDPDATDSSRQDPYGSPGQPAGLGWTFAYNEARFDRFIRLASPVELRNLLIDNFVPARITKIETKLAAISPMQPEPPWIDWPTDPVMGLPVSFGPTAVFDSAAGGGASLEAILNLVVTITNAQGDSIKATPKSRPRLTGIQREPAWQAEYLIKKPSLLAAALATGGPGAVGLIRNRVLMEPVRLNNYAGFFSMRESISSVGVDLDYPMNSLGGIIDQILLGWDWTLDLAFSRFDGDTLTGLVSGSISGYHSDV